MNWGELKQTMTRYLKRSDLVDLYPLWQDMARVRISTECKLSEQEYRSLGIPVAQYVALPFDFIEMRHLAAGRHDLEYVTAQQLNQMALKYGPSGRLRWYTILDNQIELYPVPNEDSEQVLTMHYFAKLPQLVEDSDTNRVLIAFPQLYIYAMMLESAAFRVDQGDQAIYSALWGAFVQELNAKQQAGRFSGDNLIMRAV
jgi:hypothetical protein